MDDLFPNLQQQLNKLTVIRYDHQVTNAEDYQRNCRPPQVKQGGKVSSLCKRLRQHVS